MGLPNPIICKACFKGSGWNAQCCLCCSWTQVSAMLHSCQTPRLSTLKISFIWKGGGGGNAKRPSRSHCSQVPRANSGEAEQLQRCHCLPPEGLHPASGCTRVRACHGLQVGAAAQLKLSAADTPASGHSAQKEIQNVLFSTSRRGFTCP